MNVAILFERKNSKSIKNKNILKIFSKPMFMYPLSAAKKVKERRNQTFSSTEEAFYNKLRINIESN